ncbi:hypothetical protein [Leifsonia shinshuensis]|uniref:Uncharacterized protein n=1 Tax=Leifsonia shinshuensis TaxID=150026 RepID=A0A853CR45_9MICO|nr:hypothetical protein [Leifsonia shinshuensis]NYJ22779.1 hypothetical protein [Leifsonia shinshuensis]
MVLAIADEFVVDDKRFRLYADDGWLLFREHPDCAECVGTISKTALGFLVTAWARPGPLIFEETLEEAVDRLVAIDGSHGR